ncbi:protein Flattop homolog [Drosophila erecta]|uniref:Cilia- and flagella-associated protein 126 n=1 Tax=Drosophila erecta TaxID=7220 RepID=B3NU48_DROER|nr:protein Flattop homolog [Drosophila erecta]EDV45824.1 uncharacterized protein Dere_GG18529 [Drosophila erecta]
MALSFSAQQFEGRFQSKRLNNWEYPRFSPPRPRGLLKNAKVVAAPNGHLLPGVKKEGNPFGQYRGTYELPPRITRAFCAHYDACLSGRHKFAAYPRDLCCCQRENRRALACDQRTVLGHEADPHWMRQRCQTKCEGLEQLKELNERSLRCKRAKCPVVIEKTVRMPPKVITATCVATEKRRRRHTITAFAKGRPALYPNELTLPHFTAEKPPPVHATASKPKDKPKDKETGQKDKDRAKDKGKERKLAKGHS